MKNNILFLFSNFLLLLYLIYLMITFLKNKLILYVPMKKIKKIFIIVRGHKFHLVGVNR